MNIKIRGSAQLFNENWWASSKGPIAEILQEDNEVSWMYEADPQTGKSWEPRRDSSGSWPILRKTGKMQDKVKIRPTGVGLFATKTTNYGPFHMTGTSRMVARPWLGVPMMSMPKINESIKKAILKGKTLRF